MSSLPAPPPGSRSSHLAAVIVPASRPASALRSAIEMAAELGVRAVVLCSHKAKAEQVADLASKTAGARVLAINLPHDYSHPDLLPTLTSGPAFQLASAGRMSDLSVKRNVGLLLARLQGWAKVVFLDDDISFPRTRSNRTATDSMRRLAWQLDNHHVAGMVCRDFPDNSVVCHARRLAGLPQDVFVTGAVLGVNCADRPIPFFVNAYNEDWFFFAKLAAERELRQVGEATQAEYDPFRTVTRAQGEEFGDLVAEGLYGLFEHQGSGLTFEERLAGATPAYWSSFQEDRRHMIDRTREELVRSIDEDACDERAKIAALYSLDAAAAQLSLIHPSTCVDFIAAWQEDLRVWERATQSLNDVGSTPAALDHLGLTDWRLAEFGNSQAH